MLFILTILAVSCTRSAATPTPVSVQSPSTSTVELKLVSMYGATHSSTTGWGKVFVDTVSRISSGHLTIKWLGGSEVIPSLDLPEAVSKGMVDIVITSSSYGDALVPGAGANSLCLLSPQHERETGYYSLYNQMMSTVNIRHLGRPDYPSTRVLFLNRAIEKPGDLKGVSLRSIAVDKPLVDAMGAIPISMPVGDIYGALERGVIEGVFMSWQTAADSSWYEVTTHILDHNLYLGGGQIVLWMNLDTFNKLPRQSQEWLETAASEAEKFAESYWDQVTVEKRNLFISKGVKLITFSNSNYNWYISTFYDGSWSEYLKNAPEWGPKLKDASKNLSEVLK